MAKIDPHKSKEKYLNWKKKVEKRISDISKTNSDILIKFLNDMELGLNVGNGSKKGPRSYIRLNNLRQRLTFLVKKSNEEFKINDLTKISEEQCHILFNKMRNGTITKKDGGTYASVKYYIETFKTFWHWYMKIQKKQDKIIPDITIDLDISGEKPKWVYLTEDKIKKLSNNSKFDYKVLIMFLFDSGIRSPTELINVKVEHLYDDFKKLEITDEASKTFGRKINLLLSSDLIKEYVVEKNLKDENYLFPINSKVVNRYLKRLAVKTLGTGKTLAGESYDKLTMYDFRHSSACYWLPRYKSESALKYRFGWKKSEMIHYYTEFLGMKDTIKEEDMFIDVTKTEIEKRLEQSERENKILKEKMESIEKQMNKVLGITNQLYEKSQKKINFIVSSESSPKLTQS